MAETFEPKLIVFACKWCSYAGADLAGVSRMEYPPNVRIIRTMCSGRVSPTFILKAFKLGADGVMVTGCHPGECHYITSNEGAVNVTDLTKEVMDVLGLPPDRLRLEWISASEGSKFAATVDEFTQQIRELGPVGLAAAG